MNLKFANGAASAAMVHLLNHEGGQEEVDPQEAAIEAEMDAVASEYLSEGTAPVQEKSIAGKVYLRDTAQEYLEVRIDRIEKAAYLSTDLIAMESMGISEGIALYQSADATIDGLTKGFVTHSKNYYIRLGEGRVPSAVQRYTRDATVFGLGGKPLPMTAGELVPIHRSAYYRISVWRWNREN